MGDWTVHYLIQFLVSEQSMGKLHFVMDFNFYGLSEPPNPRKLESHN
jgi:hypothetical protein